MGKLGLILTVIIVIVLVVITSTYVNYDKANIKFCNKQGFAYSSGGEKDRTEIWCGVMINDNGEYRFQGVTYQVEKKFLGGYKVKDGFDVNKELEKQRFSEYCYEKCEEDEAYFDSIDFSKLECICFELQNYTNYRIKPEYHDASRNDDAK